MNWQENKRIKGATVWVSESPRRWAVTADRDGMSVVPRNDYNHLMSKAAALESWRVKREQARQRVLDPTGEFSPQHGIRY